MFKVLILLALLAFVSSVPTPGENVETLDKNSNAPATSSLDGEQNDLEGSEFDWGWKLWPYYKTKVVYSAPVVYKTIAVQPPIVYRKVPVPQPVVYKTVSYKPPVVYQVVAEYPETIEVPLKEVNITVDAKIEPTKE